MYGVYEDEEEVEVEDSAEGGSISPLRYFILLIYITLIVSCLVWGKYLELGFLYLFRKMNIK